MELIVTGISAVNFYRTPPAVRNQYPPLPISEKPAIRRTVANGAVFEDLLKSPLHLLVTDINNRTHTKNLKQHLWREPLGKGLVCCDDVVNKITSPEMTLLIMARELSLPKLALLMYEFCGTYSTFEPNSRASKVQERATSRLSGVDQEGWHQTIDSAGRPSTLWQRPPLTSIEKLRDFAFQITHTPGIVKFRQAIDLIVGVTRSPFESKAAMLLGGPKKYGGQAFPIVTNEVIHFSENAREFSSSNYAVADILITNKKTGTLIDIECQGDMVHASEFAKERDADRALALQAMGVEIVYLSYKQIANFNHFQSFCAHLAKLSGRRLYPKSAKQMKAERELRNELFC